MTQQHGSDIQSDFLNKLVTERKTVWVFLVSGIRLTGIIQSFDKYVIAVQSPTGTQTVYKNAVSTVCEPHDFPNKRASSERSSAPRGERYARN
jgi:host factor-I protein